MESVNRLLPLQSTLAFEYHRFQKEMRRIKRVDNKARREQEARDRLTSLDRCLV